MELQRYNPAAPRAMAAGASAVAERATASTYKTLSSKLEQWGDVAYKEAGDTATKEGKAKAEEVFLSEGPNAKLNEENTIYGDSFNKALESMQSKQISIDNADNLNRLSEKYSDNPTKFTEMAEASYKGMLSEMPEHLKADFSIDYEANKVSHLGKIRQTRKKLDDEALLATHNQFFEMQLNKSTKASRDGSYSMALTEAAKAEESIQGDVDANIITAEQGRKKIDDLYKGVADSKYKGVNDRFISGDDLEGSQNHIDSFRKSKDALYSDKEREALADDMQSDLDRRLRADAAGKKATDKKVIDDSKILINDAIKIYKSGKIPDIEAVDAAYANVDVKLQHEYDVQKKAYEKSRAFSTESLQGQQAIINSLEAEKSVTRIEKEVIDVMKSNLNEKFKQSKEDPISLGAQEGLYPQTNQITPDMGVAALAKTLPERVKNRAVNVEHFGRGASFLFTETEAQAWSDWLISPETSEEEIHDFLATVESSSDGKSGSVYNQLVKKGAGVVAMAGSMIKEGKDVVGMNIIRGQKILPSLDPMLVTEMKETLRSKLDNVFKNNIDGIEPTLKSGLALYANELNTKGTFDKGGTNTDMKRLVHDLTNGIHKRNGQSFFLPKGKDSDAVDDWIDDLVPNNIDDVAGMSKDEAVKVIQNGRLVSIGPGRYMVYMKNSNAVLKNPDGKTTYVLRYAE